MAASSDPLWIQTLSTESGMMAIMAGASTAGFYLAYMALSGRWPGPWFLVFASPAAFFLASWAIRRQAAR